MSKINRLSVNECVDRGLNAPSKSHERQFWFDLAQLMLDAAPDYAPRDNGLTIQPGSLYRHEARQANNARFERTQRHGVAL